MHGIILRKTKVKDSDLVVQWLTDDDLVVAAYAAHVQSSKSFPNGLELMTVYEIELVTRPNAMVRMKSAYHVEQFDNLITDSSANACACAALESVSCVSPDDSIIIDLFSTLLQTFAVMNTVPELSPMLVAWFESFLLHQFGVLPNLDICAQCARPIVTSAFYREEVGFICTECAQNNTNISPFVLEAIRRLRTQSIRETVQKAMVRNNEKQRLHVVSQTLRFLASVLVANGLTKKLNAHRYMADISLNMPGLFDIVT